jgi:hypothetical protein
MSKYHINAISNIRIEDGQIKFRQSKRRGYKDGSYSPAKTACGKNVLNGLAGHSITILDYFEFKKYVDQESEFLCINCQKRFKDIQQKFNQIRSQACK